MKITHLSLISLLFTAACGSRSSTPAPSDESSAHAAPTAAETIENTAAAVEPREVDPDEAIALFVANDGYRVALGSYTYFLGLCDGAYDRATLEHLLERLDESTESDALTMSAATGVSYAEIVAVMDVAMQVGRTDVGLAAHGEMPAALLGDAPRPAANAACDGRAVGVELPPKRPATDHPPVVVADRATPPGPGNATGSQSLTPPIALPARDDDVDLDAVAVIAISADGIYVAADPVATLADVTASDAVPALVARLEKEKAGGSTAVVLEADRATDARILLAVIASAKAAGLDRILFAVNRAE